MDWLYVAAGFSLASECTTKCLQWLTCPGQSLYGCRYLKLIQQYKANSTVKGNVQFGRLDGFKPLTIPLVFHRASLQLLMRALCFHRTMRGDLGGSTKDGGKRWKKFVATVTTCPHPATLNCRSSRLSTGRLLHSNVQLVGPGRREAHRTGCESGVPGHRHPV